MSAPTLLLAAGLGALLLALHLLERRVTGASGARPPGARWASGRDLRALRLRAPRKGRLVLGRRGRALIAAEERASVIVVAPAQSGKTTGLAIPALLEWEGPALATSVKSDLLRDTLPRRRALGEAMVFDPTQATGIAGVHATPLSGCGDWRGAMRIAHWLAASARSGAGGLEDAEFWYAAAEKLLAPLLFAAAAGEREMADVIRWLNEGNSAKDEVRECLREAGDAEALGAFRASLARDKRQRSSIYTTAETIVAAYADPRVLDAASHADYTPAKLLDGGASTLYLCAPAHEQERLRTVFATMICELVAEVYERSSKTGRPIDPPLLIVLDEAANIAPIPNLDEIASTGAGQGIQLLSVFQDLAQLHSRYGERAKTIVNNHRAKLFGTGISDPQSLDYVRRVTGSAEFSQRSRTAGGRGQRSTTEATTYRDLAPANLVREAEPGTALLLYGHLPAARLRLRPWYAERKLRALARADSQGAPR